MRRQLLLCTAALLASVALASAQNAPSRHGQTGAGAAQEHQQSTQGHAGQAQQGAAKEQSREGRQAQGSERERTTGQATQERKSGQAAQERERSSGKAAQEHERTSTTGKAAEEKGKAPREQGMQGKAQREATPQERTTGQSQRETQQPAQTQQRQVQQPQQGQTQTQAGRQGQIQHGQAQLEGGKSLSSQQQTQIRETVLASHEVPRASNVTFALSVGTMVPTSVRVVAVPERLIAIYPAWRDHQCFIAGEDFVIVDSHRIVAVVPVGSEGGATYSSTEGYSTGSMSSEEIRELQMALRDKGFVVEVDGFFGPKTREALMQFQQRQGFQASGQLNQQTISALGIKARAQGQPSSTGQAGGKMQQPSAGMGKNQPAGAQPSTSGQSAPKMQQPSAHPGAGSSSSNAGATHGQGMSPSGNAPRTEQGK